MENHDRVESTIRTVVQDLLNNTVSAYDAVRTIDTVSRYSSVSSGDFRTPNPMSYTAVRQSNLLGQVLTVRKSDGKLVQQVNGGLGGILWNSATSGMYPDERNLLYNQALERLNERARGTLDLSVSVAEYQQVVRMVKGAASLETYVGNLAREVSRRKIDRFRALGAVLKDLGGGWLQWQYGLRPLLSDIHDSIVEINRGVIPSIMRIKGSSKRPLSSGRVRGTAWDTMCSADVNGTQGCVFVAQFKPNSGFDLARWTSLNPVSLAWELLPYSFVVDWVYDIGGMLRSLETAMLYDRSFVSGYYTELRAYSGSVSVKGIYPGGNLTTEIYDARLEGSYVRFDRVRLASWPLPRLPSWKVNLGSERLLSAAALLAQQLR